MRLLVCVLCVVCVSGCAYQKAVDTTAAVRAVTEAESHVTYTVLPGDLLQDEQLAGRAVMLPTIPGKDVAFRMYYPTGQLRAELETKRGHVIDTILQGAAGIDAGKAIESAAERQFFAEQLANVLAFAREIATMRSATPAETGGGNARRSVLIPAALAALRTQNPSLADAIEEAVGQTATRDWQPDLQAITQALDQLQRTAQLQSAQIAELMRNRPPASQPANP